jgi:hypothetical protein
VAPYLQTPREDREHDYDPHGPHLAIYTGLDEIYTEEELSKYPPSWNKHAPWQWRNVHISQGNYKYEDDITDYFEPGTPKQ